MPFLSPRHLTTTFAVALLCLPYPVKAALQSPNWLPDTTKEYMVVENVPRTLEHWSKTQYARILAEKSLAPVADELRRQFNMDSEAARRFGLTWNHLLAAAN